jgi:hypothetical protein
MAETQADMLSAHRRDDYGGKMATKEVQDGENQFIPGAASYNEKFLGIVLQRCNESGLGITLGPVRVGRKDPRTVLRGSITFGNAWKGKRPYTLEVYADPQGQNLQVGYQLTTDEIGGLIGNTAFGSRLAQSQSNIHNDPKTQRELTGILQGFNQMVFLPTLQDLVEAVGVQRPANGFLGA